MDDATKAVFQMAAEARKQRGIKLRKIGFMAEEKWVEVFHFIYDGWIQRFGKEDALDFLLSAMCEAERRLQEWDDAKRAAKNRTRLSRSKKHSAA